MVNVSYVGDLKLVQRAAMITPTIRLHELRGFRVAVCVWLLFPAQAELCWLYTRKNGAFSHVELLSAASPAAKREARGTEHILRKRARLSRGHAHLPLSLPNHDANGAYTWPPPYLSWHR